MTRFFILPLFAALALIAAPAQAELSAADKTEIETMIKDYIMANPQVLIDSLEKQRADQQAQAETQAKEAAKELIVGLDDSGLPMAGAKDADVTIVEFMDYNCGYCKKAFEEVRSVLDNDKKVKFFFVDMPILGPTSMEAAKWALAAQKQGKYFEFHRALMEHQGPKNDAILEDKAEDAGLDIKQAKKDKESKAVEEQLNANLALAEQIGITGTPGFIIGEEVVRGYITLDQMKEVIAAERE